MPTKVNIIDDTPDFTEYEVGMRYTKGAPFYGYEAPVCPKCGSCNICHDTNAAEFDGAYIFYRAECDDCKLELRMTAVALWMKWEVPKEPLQKVLEKAAGKFKD